ncbi:MAG: hypothetical protein ACKVPX_08430 [Myxococcaceae bacterium]
MSEHGIPGVPKEIDPYLMAKRYLGANLLTGHSGETSQAMADEMLYGIGGTNIAQMARTFWDTAVQSGSVTAGLGRAWAMGQQSVFGVDTYGLNTGSAQHIVNSPYYRVMNRPIEVADGSSLEDLVRLELGEAMLPHIKNLPPAVRQMMVLELMQQQSKRLTEFFSNWAHTHHKMLESIINNMGRVA